MKDGLRRLLPLLLAPWLLAACQSEPAQELHGYLYFGIGSYLARLDLRNGETEVVTKVGDAELRSLSAQRGERLLLSIYGRLNDYDTHQLLLYDRDSRQQMPMFKGRHGHYLPGSDVLVYDDGRVLRVMQKTGAAWNVVEAASHEAHAEVAIVPVDASRFLFEIDGHIDLFDSATGVATPMPALQARCALSGALWLQDRDSLLCRAADEERSYSFVQMDGSAVPVPGLPGTGPLLAVALLADQQMLVLTEPARNWWSRRTRWRIWLYPLDDAAPYRLVDDQYLGESVVYSPS